MKTESPAELGSRLNGSSVNPGVVLRLVLLNVAEETRQWEAGVRGEWVQGSSSTRAPRAVRAARLLGAKLHTLLRLLSSTGSGSP